MEKFNENCAKAFCLALIKIAMSDKVSVTLFYFQWELLIMIY